MSYEEIGIDIRDVQLAELEILLEFDRICQENKIPYQLFSGTLLGAVRHGGFIPWDDDIDVCMLRPDYDRFISICQNGSLDKRFFLQTCFTDLHSVVQFAKLRKNGTVFENNVDCSPDTHTGIYIDIFPMDRIPDDEAELKKWLNGIRRLYILETSSVWERVKYASSFGKRVLRGVLHLCIKIVNKKRIDSILQRRITRYNKCDTRYVSHMTNVITLEHTRQYQQEPAEFLDVIYADFEGHQFPIPKNYDSVLTSVFGNYMALPPESEQKPNHGVLRVVL